eukprot:Tbor_TRINITY_DN5646_c0_g2::TRINITY_DN5646_c0_g2_i2::g.9319::m.9319
MHVTGEVPKGSRTPLVIFSTHYHELAIDVENGNNNINSNNNIFCRNRERIQLAYMNFLLHDQPSLLTCNNNNNLINNNIPITNINSEVISFIESLIISKGNILATGAYTEDDELIIQMDKRIDTYTRMVNDRR